MARGDPLYAKVEVDFWLDDPRLIDLPEYAQNVYLGLWCLAVRCRTDRLPSRYSLRSVAGVLRKDPRSVAKALAQLRDSCTDAPLIGEDENGRILIYGCGKVHSSLRTWKEHASPNRPQVGPKQAPNRPQLSRNDAGTEAEAEAEAEAPDAPANGRPTEQDVELARWMRDRLRRTSSRPLRRVDVRAWADVIRLMRERDGFTAEQIREVFAWANDEPFWRPNIRSPRKLREKWDTLTGQMDRPQQRRDKPKSLQEPADKYDGIGIQVDE